MESNLLILFLFLKFSVPGWAMRLWLRISHSRREGWQRGLFHSSLQIPSNVICHTWLLSLPVSSPGHQLIEALLTTLFPHRALFFMQQPSANQGLGLHPGLAYPGPMAGTVPRAPDTFGGATRMFTFKIREKMQWHFLVEENVLI